MTPGSHTSAVPRPQGTDPGLDTGWDATMRPDTDSQRVLRQAGIRSRRPSAARARPPSSKARAGAVVGVKGGNMKSALPNGSRLSCGRNARGRKAVEPQTKRLASEATQFFPPERP